MRATRSSGRRPDTAGRKCTHGSSVGPIDKTHVYYLMTRGLPRADAERLVVQGFFEPVIERIASEDLKERVRAAVDAKIGGKGA
ncbi:MAG: hypothetical protein EBS89_07260 [Proteobacteria bacterium]|nr:hypothetical protein [Pseudomonadota bacterium]